MGDFGMRQLVVALFLLLVLGPFGLWKLGEVVWWLATHVRISW